MCVERCPRRRSRRNVYCNFQKETEDILFSLAFAVFDGFLADRTNRRAIATLLRLSSSVCDVMYCG